MHNQAPNSDSSNISRPAAFPLKIQGGMLEALGINMYATIGKCLVEFVANAFDSEATTVDIVIPTGDIQSARADAKARAKDEVEKLQRDPSTVLLPPLPDDIAITLPAHGQARKNAGEGTSMSGRENS